MDVLQASKNDQSNTNILKPQKKRKTPLAGAWRSDAAVKKRELASTKSIRYHAVMLGQPALPGRHSIIAVGRRHLILLGALMSQLTFSLTCARSS